MAGPVVVAVMEPASLHADARRRTEELDRLRAHPEVAQVLVAPYQEPAEVRTRRSAPGHVRAQEDEVPLDGAVRSALASAEVAIALDLPFGVPALAPHLRWVQAIGSGVGQLLTAGLAEGGVRLANGAGTASHEIAEFVLARILEHWKRLPELAAAQRRREWSPSYGRPVSGSTLGLVGLGAIGSAVAGRARALGMRIEACRASGAPSPEVDAVVGPDGLRGLARRCDALVVAVPETADTRALVDAEVLAAMRPGSLLCNVGRGSVIDEQALVDALGSGHLGGAALDVFASEPLPRDSPLWAAPRLRVSAHCASVPSASVARAHGLLRENLHRAAGGRRLRNEVDLERGY
ncbi:D-2-hydroxyacid dehydrogenase [Iamia majanohamensis]|uniref:D-2-hydroxyacid dehydrogenase n=1 Tax=Iamia majanohamensis TaxID=467976 RepID=A0AAE9YB87_9ACTN|nr:D-2-hydroxyacid dehydrogenase [Iamia majanohamensis]WCO67829.1 D-2-hydroxyacid dehydrogenase [Iamia majanohamensis]